MIEKSRFYLLASFITIAINFLTLPFFTQYLSPSDYGIIGLFIIIGNITTSLFSFGLNTATYGLYFNFSNNNFRILNTTVFLFLILIFLIVGISFILPFSEMISIRVFDNKINGELIEFAFLNGVFNYIYIFYGQLLIAQKRAKAYSLLLITQVAVNALITFYLLYFHSMTYLAALYGVFASNILVFFLSLFLNRKFFTINLSLPRIIEALKFGMPEVPNTMISLLYGAFDRVMLTNFKGLSDLGYYDFANKFASIFKIIIDAIGKAFSPFFLEESANRKGDFKHNIVKKFYEISVILGFFGIAISLFSEEALIILTTSEFYFAKFFVPILICFYLFGLLGQISINQFIHSKKLHYLIPISLIGLIVNITLNIIFIPKYGVMGAAFSTSFSAMITSILQLYYGNKLFNLPLNLNKLASLFLLILICLGAGYSILFLEFNYLIKLTLKIIILFLYLFFVLRFNFINIFTLRKNLSFGIIVPKKINR
jgi:O-antigen/teichoic acid export membrane protein